MTDTTQNFTDCFVAELKAHATSEPHLADFIKEFEGIDCASARTLPANASLPTVERFLQRSLQTIGCAGPLADAVKDLAGAVRWYQIFSGEGIEPNLAQGLVAGQLAGGAGIVHSTSIATGLFLLAPGISYPSHQHGALEIYFVVSGQLTLQHGRTAAPFKLGPGEWSITPSNRVHALKTSEEPCLLIYAWVGDLTAPNWWWEQDAAGTWQRICWERGPDARWLQTRSEPITDDVLAEAGEG